MLNLNDEAIKEDGNGKNFDPSKIFGFSVIENDEIVDTVDNVRITEFKIDKNDKGGNYFDIVLQDENGNTTNLREYEPDATRSDFESKKKSQLTRLKHLVTKYTPEGTQLPQANTFPELWAGVRDLLGQNNCRSTPMRLKLVFNDKGYLTVPKYVPYLESMTVPKTESKLKLDRGFDNLIKSKPDTMKSSSAEQAGDTDELPF